MYGIDQLTLAACLAAMLFLPVAMFLQAKWRLYTVFLGKRHDLTIHYIVMGLIYAELVAMTILDIYSKWMFSSILWPIGAVVFAGALALFVATISESGIGWLFGKAAFRKYTLHKGDIWRTYRQPYIVSVVGLYVGLALLSGHYVYIIISILLGVGLTFVDWLTRKLKP